MTIYIYINRRVDFGSLYIFVLFNIVVAILLHDDDVVLLSSSEACLQRLMNKLYEFCTT